MKTLWKSLFIALVMLGTAGTALADVLFTEDFNYTAGQGIEGLGNPAWTVSTKTAGETAPGLLVADADLTVTNYGAGTGYALIIPTKVDNERTVYRHFTASGKWNAGSLYIAFVLQVDSATSQSRDFIAFEGSTGTTQRGRLFCKKDGTGFQLGITRAGTAPATWIGGLKLKTPILVVMKYSFVDGELNDVATLYADFPLGYDEMSSEVQAHASASTDVETTSADPSALRGVSIKQRPYNSGIRIAHMRAATTWSEAVNYTGPAVGPADPNEVKMHFTEGFDSNGSWTITGGASTSQNHGLYGDTKRCLAFNVNDTRDRCTNAQACSPLVNTAGVLRFWIMGSSRSTRASITVSKIVGTDTTLLAYLPGTFGNEWEEHTVVVNDQSANIRILFTTNDCSIGTGTLYMDDITLTDFHGSTPPSISALTRQPMTVSNADAPLIQADIDDPDDGDRVEQAVVEYGTDPAQLDNIISMTQSAATTYRATLPIMERNSTVYYRIIAFDTHYVSDTTALQSYTVYKAYQHKRQDITLEAQKDIALTEGYDAVRIDFSGTEGQPVSISVNGTAYSGTGHATTGDLTLHLEPGQALNITNTSDGATTLQITLNYDDFSAITFDNRPQTLQLYPRAIPDNTANVLISGTNHSSQISQATFRLLRNGQQTGTQAVEMPKDQPFSLQFEIKAEPALYKVDYTTDGGTTYTVLADSIVAGDVYIIAGQSNGAASASGNVNQTSPYWRNFGCVQKTNPYNPADTLWGLSNSAGWGYGRQWYNGYSGYVLQRQLLNDVQMPTAIINMSVGGSTLDENMPNPDNHADITTYYGRGLYRLQKAGLHQAVRAIIWVQGEADQNGVYDSYATRFNTLYNTWKTDYPNLEQIYVSQINIGCGTGSYGSELREIQRRFAQVYDDITVNTNVGIEIRYDSCHYTDEGYEKLYGLYAELIERDLYGSTFDYPVTSPAVQGVRYANSEHTLIEISFDQEVVWPAPMWNRDMKDFFYDQDDQQLLVSEGYIHADDPQRVMLRLAQPATATALTYGPDSYVFSPTRGCDTIYIDPWIRNPRGYAALTFNRFPIAAYDETALSSAADDAPVVRQSPTSIEVIGNAEISRADIITPAGQIVHSTRQSRIDIASLHGVYLLLATDVEGRTYRYRFIRP